MHCPMRVDRRMSLTPIRLKHLAGAGVVSVLVATILSGCALSSLTPKPASGVTAEITEPVDHEVIFERRQLLVNGFALGPGISLAEVVIDTDRHTLLLAHPTTQDAPEVHISGSYVLLSTGEHTVQLFVYDQNRLLLAQSAKVMFTVQATATVEPTASAVIESSPSSPTGTLPVNTGMKSTPTPTLGGLETPTASLTPSPVTTPVPTVTSQTVSTVTPTPTPTPAKQRAIIRRSTKNLPSVACTVIVSRASVRNGPASAYRYLGTLFFRKKVRGYGTNRSGRWIMVSFEHSQSGQGWILRKQVACARH